MYTITQRDYTRSFREFTLQDIETEHEDHTMLSNMATLAFEQSKRHPYSSEQRIPSITYLNEPGHPLHRVVTYTSDLPDASELAFVGFLGKKREQISGELPDHLSEVDQQMIDRLASFPTLLSYSSFELADHNWCNLVVFRPGPLREDLLATALHQHAAYELAPQYYQWIRIHRGLITGDAESLHLRVHMTRYYTFHTLSSQPTIRVQSYIDPTSLQDVAH